MSFKTLTSLAVLATLFNPSISAVVPRAITADNLQAAYNALQQWYNSNTGLWIPSTGWWNSANCLTVIADLAAVDSGLKSQISSVISTTYSKAPSYHSAMLKVVEPNSGSKSFLMQTFYQDQWPYIPPAYAPHMDNIQSSNYAGFLNDYYDDEGWWALGWIAAYDLTGNSQYLSQAQSIFADMYSVFGKTSCSSNSGGSGGIWWDKSHSYVNAIANELFFTTAAALANRAQSSGNINYLTVAKQQLAWFKGTGMINSGSTINDGLDQQSCKNNGGTVWSYNQGVILGGLVELSKATGDSSHISTAHSIAAAAIAKLAPSGILRDPCEPGCGADGSQFKGIFVRNLAILQKASPKDAYKSFLQNNAQSIWANDRNQQNQLSVSWAGPYNSAYPANASTQSSAMDCLVASVAVA